MKVTKVSRYSLSGHLKSKEIDGGICNSADNASRFHTYLVFSCQYHHSSRDQNISTSDKWDWKVFQPKSARHVPVSIYFGHAFAFKNWNHFYLGLVISKREPALALLHLCIFLLLLLLLLGHSSKFTFQTILSYNFKSFCLSDNLVLQYQIILSCRQFGLTISDHFVFQIIWS